MLCNEYLIDDVELLWQHMSEDSVYIDLKVNENQLADWEDCDGETIYDFLEDVQSRGFIESYGITKIKK